MMKKSLLYTICLMALAISALPVSANDYLKIYFKDGHTERHYMKLVESISASKYDLEGNPHEDYQVQQIVMKDTTYSYYIADIDSMSFRKVDEEEVKTRVESVQSSLEQILQQSSNMEDLASHVDEIKSIDGVEEVYYDGNDLFIQIKDWFVVSIIRQPMPENIVTAASTLARRNTRLLEPTTEEESPLKVTIGFQMKDDYNFVDSKVEIYLLNTKFSVMGYNPNYYLGEELDFDFFYRKIFDSNVLLIDTHGGCGLFNKKHYLFTGIESSSNDLVGLNLDRWLNISKNIDLDDIGVSLCGYAGGNLFNNPFGLRWFFTVTEDYIQKSSYRFTGSGPHIVFVAACSSLQGNDILTRSDGIHPYGSDSFAQIFFNKGADVYLGYNSGTYRSSFAADCFFEYMLQGASVEQAFNTLHPLYKYEEDKDEKAVLVDLYNKNSEDPKGIFIVNTHTVSKTDQETNEEFLDKQQVELKGITYCLDLDDICPQFGFKVAMDPHIDESTTGEYIVSENAHYTGVKNKEVAFSAVFKPESGQTYYYCAYSYDGKYYNFGDICSFKTPAEIPAEAVDLGLPSGTLWAKWNMGATAPEEYGDYYAWGETETKKGYGWYNYEHCDGTDDTCHDIGVEISGTKYDVAHVKWGGDWQLPTADQINELVKNCKHKVTTSKGVKGTLVTGPNGNTIFLPCAGFMAGTTLYGPGKYGLYKSGTRCGSDMRESWLLNADADGFVRLGIWNSTGHSVRPVISGK